MKIRWITTVLLATAFCLTLSSTQTVHAQDNGGEDPFATPESFAEPATDPFAVSETAPRSGMFDSTMPRVSDSNINSSKPTAAELRQARAIYQAQQRLARMERNRWMGYEPLRPTWSSVHMMQSRYPRPTLFVPVYHWGY